MNHQRRAAGPWFVLFAGLLAAGSVGCASVRPGCGCPLAGVIEPGCGCEPSCGCDDVCGVGGCSHAGEKWCGDCSCECGPKKPLFNPCIGGDCGCEVACEPGCGCEPSCGAVGCGSTCGTGCGPCPLLRGAAFGLQSIGAEVRRLLSPLGVCCPHGGCGGCGELYWNEWHSDPPACHDPCDDCGTWVGPSQASLAPQRHQNFSPRRTASHDAIPAQLR